MANIDIKNLTYSYENSSTNIFDNLNLTLDSDWKLGLIGKNGRGKTTFLKILANKLNYGGTINSKINFEYFPFNIDNENQLVIDIIQEFNNQIDSWKIEKELNLLDIGDKLYEYFPNLSEGEKVKVKLAILFLKENYFLLIDEPTNHLDLAGREAIGNYLNKKKGFLIVSHDRNFLNLFSDHILSINNNSIDLIKGNYQVWKENKDKKDANEFKNNEKLHSEIKRLKKSAQQKKDWSDKIEKTKNASSIRKNNHIDQRIKPDKGYLGAKSAKMMKKSITVQKRIDKSIEMKETLLKDVEAIDSLMINIEPINEKVLLKVENLIVKYNENTIIDNLSFTIKKHDIICLMGKNGSGKSSLLKAIINNHEGIFKPQRLKISYLYQNSENLKGSLSVFIKENNLSESIFYSILRKLGFKRDEFSYDMSSYSSGQKKKVLLAKSLLEPANLYLWDEPLNYLDLDTRIQLEKLLQQYKPTMIIVEHDHEFINNIATSIIDLNSV